MPKISSLIPLLSLLAVLLFGHGLQAQDDEDLDSPIPSKLLKDKGIVVTDSVNNTQGVTDSVKVYYGEKGDIETTVVYHAKDSVRFDVINRIMHLYNEAKITYGTIVLEAGYIQVDWKNFTLTAHALQDTSGETIGIPIFTDNDQNYNADSIKYNFKTGKGIVKGIVTQQGEGFLQSDKAKKLPDGTLYNSSSLYTTCDLKEPHFAIHARKLKLNPKKNVVSGPFNLEVNGIPTPLGFAFGMFPMPDKRNSGLIIPAYGESQDRGFFLRDGGFYWAVSDYLSMKFLGQIYSAGGWGTSLDASYRKRYAYSGSLNLSYNKVVRQGDAFDDDITKDFWIKWNHAPVPRGTGRFSANVNFGTQTYNRNNSFNVDNYLSSTFTSSVSYSKTFPGTPFSLSANVRHNQNVQTSIVKVFPETSLTMNRIFPLKKLFKGASKSPLALLNVAYTFNAKMDISNDINKLAVGVANTIQSDYDDIPDTVQFNVDNLSLILDRSKFGGVHRVPISTSITLLKFVQLNPSLNYQEFWYPKRLNYEWDAAESALRIEEEDGFFRSYSWDASVGARTTFYNFFYFKENLPVKAIRQLITPSASFGYRPDFEDPKFGFYEEVQIDEDGNFDRLSRFQGSVFGGPSGGSSESFNINLETSFEAKVANKKDTVNGEKKVQLLRMNTSYNVLADSFNLSKINFITNAKLWNSRISLTLNGAFDPYAYTPTYDEDGNFQSQVKENRFTWNEGQGLRISSLTIAANTRLTPEGLKGADDPLKKSTSAGQDPTQAVLDDIAANPDRYVDFNVPWSLSLRYNLRYSKTGFQDANVTQTINFSGDVSLTEKWKLNFSSGYDFKREEFSFTSLGIIRDLHCWEMAVNWIPFGFRQSYTIDIRVKSSILKDLKVSKRNYWYDR